MTITTNLGEIKEMVESNAPIVYLYPKEEYLPSSFSWYLDRVYYQGAGQPVGPPVQKGDLPPNLSGINSYIGYKWGSKSISHGSPEGAPAYVHVLGFKDDSSGGQLNGYHLQYWFFYPFNGPAKARISPATSDLHIDFSVAPGGDHQGDWEHVTVFTDAEGKFQKLYCAQHSSGTFYQKDEVSFEGTNPVVYSAWNGHPSYPSVGVFTTPKSQHIIDNIEFRLINQTAKGLRWDCSKQHEIIAVSGVPGVEYEEPWWLQFYGYAGAVNPNQAIEEVVAAELEKIKIEGKPVPEDVAKIIADLWVCILSSIENFNGPQMPKAKSDWMSPSDNP